MRGKVYLLSEKIRSTGITPAYAGKRSVRRLHKGIRWDHPRLCGEKLIPIEFGGIETGSPPPMRGKGSALMQSKATAGITPAYAGKRSFAFCP